jgi:hypothetical protein
VKKKNNLFRILKINEEKSRIRIYLSEVRIRGSGSAPKFHGSPTLKNTNQQQIEINNIMKIRYSRYRSCKRFRGKFSFICTFSYFDAFVQNKHHFRYRTPLKEKQFPEVLFYSFLSTDIAAIPGKLPFHDKML